MEYPKIGDKVSLWVEGEVVSIEKNSNYEGGIKVEVLNDQTRSHCFVSLLAIEPKEVKV
jgi:hypothetical protein